MAHQPDTIALPDIQRRLGAQFPQLADEVVEAAVRVSMRTWRDWDVHYLSRLVEETARRRLSDLV